MKITQNEWISNLSVYEPGRPMKELARELGLESAEEITKLASNENALGPAPSVIEAMSRAAGEMHIYPDGSSFYLRQALAEKLNVEMEQIIIGNGSNELIEFLAHVYLSQGKQIVMSDRAFIVYKLIASAYHAQTISVPMKGFTHDLDAMLAAITPDTRLVFIANPNNPTGTAVASSDIERFMEQVPDHVEVVFDEAYIEFLPPEQRPDTLRYVRERSNVYVLRTFSKAYGLAGLRIGYGVASAEAVELLHRVRQPFNVNAMAQVAAQAALADDAHLNEVLNSVAEGRRMLEAGLNEMGIEFVPSVANFILVKTGQARRVFAELQRKLLIVRAMDGYGLPDYVRITVGTPEQNKQILTALNELILEGTIHE